MGLRFRRSVTLCKGVRLNFGLHGASVTTGVKGFHNTYHLGTGRRTTSVGIPGTGLSYVSISGGRNNTGSNQNGITQEQPRFDNYGFHPNEFNHAGASSILPHEADEIVVPDEAFLVRQPPTPSVILTTNQLTSIHFKTDTAIDWTEMLVRDTPPDGCEDESFWAYCHERAYEVLNGNIDMYLQVIQDVGPFEDLMDYGLGFECGTDNPNLMVVEFQTREEQIMPPKSTLSPKEYYELLQDYICSCTIRIARDVFALLPVADVIVHASERGRTVLSVRFERKVFMKTKFQGTDASDLVCRFKHNMQFDSNSGFLPVSQLEG